MQFLLQNRGGHHRRAHAAERTIFGGRRNNGLIGCVQAPAQAFGRQALGAGIMFDERVRHKPARHIPAGMPAHSVRHHQQAVPVAAVQRIDLSESVFLVLAPALDLQGGDAAGLNIHGRISDYTRCARYVMVRMPATAILLLRVFP